MTLYRVRTIQPCRSPNPAFVRGQPITPDNFPTVEIPVGTEIEHVDAWILCLPEFSTDLIRAEPIDEATRIKVEAALQARAAKIAAREAAQAEQERRAPKKRRKPRRPKKTT